MNYLSNEKAIYIKCECACCVLEISKYDFGEGECGYDIAVLDNSYDHKVNGVWNHIKRAAKALFGKPVCFNDVSLTPERYDKLIEQMIELRDSEVDE